MQGNGIYSPTLASSNLGRSDLSNLQKSKTKVPQLTHSPGPTRERGPAPRACSPRLPPGWSQERAKACPARLRSGSRWHRPWQFRCSTDGDGGRTNARLRLVGGLVSSQGGMFTVTPYRSSEAIRTSSTSGTVQFHDDDSPVGLLSCFSNFWLCLRNAAAFPVTIERRKTKKKGTIRCRRSGACGRPASDIQTGSK